MKADDLAVQVANQLATQYGQALPGAVDRALGRAADNVTRGVMETTMHIVEVAHFIVVVTPFALDMWHKTKDRQKALAETTAAAETLKEGDNLPKAAKKAVIEAAIDKASAQV